MKKTLDFCLRMMKIGSIGFGGGSALIPVLEQEFVPSKGKEAEEKKTAFEKDVVIASLTPGALPVEIASSIGRREIGEKGMILGSVMMALPGALISLLCFLILAGVSDDMIGYVKAVSIGVSAFIICLLLDYIAKTIKTGAKQNRNALMKILIVVGGIAFLVCGSNIRKLTGWYQPIFGVSTVTVLLTAFYFYFYTRKGMNLQRVAFAGVIGLIYLLGHGKAGILAGTWICRLAGALMFILAIYGASSHLQKRSLHFPDLRPFFKDTFKWILFLCILALPAYFVVGETISFICRGVISAFMSFGGGDAYLTIAEGLFVDTNIVDSNTFFGSIVTVVNVLPGSILCKTLTGVGFYCGYASGGAVPGILLALAGFGCSVAASGTSYWMIYNLYDSFMGDGEYMGISRWIRPIIAGLLANVILSLICQCQSAAQYSTRGVGQIILFLLGITGVDLLIRKKWKNANYWILIGNVILSLLFLKII